MKSRQPVLSAVLLGLSLSAAPLFGSCGLLSDEREEREDGRSTTWPGPRIQVEIVAIQFKDDVVATRAVIDSVGARHGLAYLWWDSQYKEQLYFVDRRIVPENLSLETIVRNVGSEQRVKAVRGFDDPYWIELWTYENSHAPGP